MPHRNRMTATFAPARSHPAGIGRRPAGVEFDWARVMARKDRIVARTEAGSAEERYRREGITLFRGSASFEDDRHVRVAGRLLRGDKFMIATGAGPERPAIDGIAEAAPITSVEAVDLRRL